MEVVNVYRESLPAVKLVGKRYTDKDRDASGTFAAYWQQWAREGWFDLLEKDGASKLSDGYLGAMRMTGGGGQIEYWIGAFLPLDAQVPDGFEAVEIPAGDLGVCWIRGNEQNGELYGPEASKQSMAALAEKGWTFSEAGWFFERYNHPRFTTPDEKGNIILDICVYLTN